MTKKYSNTSFRKEARRLSGLALSLCLIILGSSCSENEEAGNNSQVETTFHLKSQSAIGGLLTIQDAYLKLDRIEATGTLQEKAVAGAALVIPAEDPPFQLSRTDSPQVTFTLPSRNYDQMELHLHFFQDDYQLILSGKPPVNEPEPAEGGTGGSNDGQTDGESGSEQPPGGSSGGSDGSDNNGGSGDEDKNEGDDAGGEDSNGGEQGNGDGDSGNDGDQGSDDDDEADEDQDDENEDERDNDEEGKENDEGKDNDDKKDKGKKDNDKDRNDDDDDDDEDDDDEEDDDDDDEDDDRDDDGRDDRKAEINTSQTVDLDHFFQNAKPALVVFATYSNNGKNISVIFVVTGAEKISIPATQNENGGIILNERNSAFVTFDPDRWFASIPPGVIESGEIQSYQGQQVLFIHKDFNTPLFEILYSRFVQSAEFRFHSPNTQ